MANIPSWFDGSTYMTNKLKALQTADPDANWTYDKMVDAFTAAGFIGEEGYYNHFEQYGSTAAENLSPNKYFVPSEYYQFKAINYFTSEAGGSLTEATVRGNMQYYAGQIKQAFTDANMSAWQHYQNYGASEKLNTSNSFDESSYLDAKAAALNKAEGVTTWTADNVRDAIIKAGMTPLSHYMEYAGKGDNEVAEGATYAVPADEKVTTGSDSSSDTTGSEFALTTAIGETLTGTTGNDTFTGLLGGATETLNPTDHIVGNGGVDTFEITMGGAGAGLPAGVKLEGLNKVVIDVNAGGFNGGNGIDASAFGEIKELWQTEKTMTNIDNVTEASGIAVGYAGGAVLAGNTVDFGATAKEGTILLDGVGTGSTVALLNTGNAKVATLNVEGSVAGAGALTVTPNTNTVSTIALALTSKGTVTITDPGVTDGLKTIDAGGSTGDLTMDLVTTPSFGKLANVSFGGGNDTLTVDFGGAKSAGKDVTVSMGAGADTVTVTADASTTAPSGASTLDLGEGVDTLKLGNVGTINNVLSAATADDDAVTALLTVNGFTKGDILDVSAGGANSFTKVTGTVQAQIDNIDTSDADALCQAVKLAEGGAAPTATDAFLFEFNGDSYIYIANAATTGLQANDGLIKLAGVDTDWINVADNTLVGA